MLLTAAIVLLLVFLLGATAAVLTVMRRHAIGAAEQNLADVAGLLAEYQRQSSHTVEVVLDSTVRDIGALPAGARLEDERLQERLRERERALPHLLEILVIDAEGRLRNHSGPRPPPSESYATRDFFAAHRDGRVTGLYIGMPRMPSPGEDWRQSYSLRIDDSAGRFAGVVAGNVLSDHTADLLRSLQVGPGGRIAVLRADGILISTHPRTDNAVGRSFADDPMFARDLPTQAAAVQRRPGLLDAGTRFFAYRRVDAYPLVVAVTSTERHVLAEWRRTAYHVGAGAAASAVFIGLMLLLALRQMRIAAGLQGELRDAGERLHGILQSAMDAVITVDESQKILLFNAAAERIFRCAAAEAVGRPLDLFIPERFRAAHRRHVDEFGVTGASSRQMGGPRLELKGLRKDGEEFPIDASISQVTAAGRKLYTVILRDATERRRAEDELQRAYHERREAADQLRGILQSAMDAVITTDWDQKIILFNESAEKIFRVKAEEVVGSPLDRFIPQRFRAAHRDHVGRFGETRVTTRMMGKRQALVGLRSDGEEFPIDASISQVTVEGRKLYTVILRDVTERRRAEQALERSYEELRQLSAAMNDVREAERTRIARELHDELAQWLTALKMDVSWLSARLPAEPAQLLQRADKMKQLLDVTVTAVRRIASDLRPVMLDDLGLVPSIEHVAHTFSERTGVPVSLDIRTTGADLRDPVATGVYRIVQEALTNIARHARATDVAVLLEVRDHTLRVRVRDNGIGLRQPGGGVKSHGLLGMKERAQTLGGSATISSPPEGGTLVEIAIPLARYEKREAAG